MTRKEYEKKYGVKPVFTATSTIDTTPALRRMTRAEYNAEFATPEPKSFLKSTGPSFKASEGGAKSVIPNVAKTFGNIPSSARDLTREVIAPANPFDLDNPLNIGSNIAKSGFVLNDIIKERGVKQGLKDIAGGFMDLVKKGGDVYKGIGEKIYENLEKNVIERDSVAGGVGASSAELLDKVAKIGIEDPLLIPSILYAPKGTRVAESRPDIISRVASPVTRGADTSLSNIASKTRAAVATKVATRSEAKITSTIERELFNIENNYVATRKLNSFVDDAGAASRRRIAQTDVLAGAVDENGIIRTRLPGGAVEKYTAQTIDGIEGVVRDGLRREGKSVNLKQLERDLTLAINDSGLEGADLITALNGVKKEIQGLKLRADEFNNVLLEKVHDAKISTTKNINFQTPPETATYRKAIARSYKDIVVKNSDLNVDEVNKELSKYYADIKRLEALDGKRVKGGKLGKYAAQASGSVVGGITGGAIGGLPGAAIGSILGGEVNSLMRGKQMARTFKGGNRVAPKNPILEKAAAESKLPPVTDLTKPSPKVGAGKNIPKTKEIYKVEKDIEKNIQAQKAAIKAGDFTLVAKLKEVYNLLVEKLKELIQEAKKLPKNRGHIKNPFASKADKGSGKQLSQSSPTSAKNTQSKGNSKGEGGISFQRLPDEPEYAFLNRVDYETKKANMSIDDIVSHEGAPDRKRVEFYINKIANGEPVDPIIVIKEGRVWGAEDGKHKLQAYKELGYKNVHVLEQTRNADGQRLLRDPFNKKYTGSTKKQTSTGSKSFTPKQVAIYNGEKDLTTKTLEKLRGRSTVSKQFIQDLTNSPDLKQAEKDLIRNMLKNEGATVNVKEFAKKVKTELLPLKRRNISKEFDGDFGGRYESVNLPDDLRGPVANYNEHIYESPIKTSAGDVHFRDNASQNYFAHTRIEDMADGKTRRVIEAQSDLFQKGRLEGEATHGLLPYKAGSDIPVEQMRNNGWTEEQIQRALNENKSEVRQPLLDKRAQEIAKLEPYRNTWHERVIREEVKQAAVDGKTKLQFPTGETAMKIEGLGERTTFVARQSSGIVDVTPENLRVGVEIIRDNGARDMATLNQGEKWIITDVLGDGKFKAVPKERAEQWASRIDPKTGEVGIDPKRMQNLEGINWAGHDETFDISGKVDTDNPIYKFYEKEVGRYLKNKYNATLVTDERGVKWWELPVKKEYSKIPIEAYGIIPAIPIAANQ